MQIRANNQSLKACLSSIYGAEQDLGVKLSHEVALDTVLTNSTVAFAPLERLDLAVGSIFINPGDVQVARYAGRVDVGDDGSESLWGAALVADPDIATGRVTLVVEDCEVDKDSLTPPTYSTNSVG